MNGIDLPTLVSPTSGLLFLTLLFGHLWASERRDYHLCFALAHLAAMAGQAVGAVSLASGHPDALLSGMLASFVLYSTMLLEGVGRFAGEPISKAWWGAALLVIVAVDAAGLDERWFVALPAVYLASAGLVTGLRLLGCRHCAGAGATFAAAARFAAAGGALIQATWFADAGLGTWNLTVALVLQLAAGGGILLLCFERRRREAAWSLARFRSLFDGADVGICRIRRETGFVDVNPAFVRMLGYDTDREVLALRVPDQLCAEPEGWERAFDQCAEAGDEGLELQWLRRDGTAITVHGKGSRVLDSGEPGLLQGFFTNVTAQRAVVAALFQARKMESLGRLAGGMAHAFNNVLTVMELVRGLLAEQVRGSEESERFLEQVGKETRKLAGLTAQLLAVGRRQVLRPELVDLCDFARGLSELFERSYSENVQVHVECPRTPVLARLDRGRIGQALFDLLLERARTEGQVGPFVLRVRELAAEPEAEPAPDAPEPSARAVLELFEAGREIADSALDRVFDPHVPSSGALGDVGLAPASTYGVVAQSGGELRVSNDPNLGTCYRLVLPRAESEEVAALARPEPAPAPDGSAEGSGTILVAEDDRALRAVVARILRHHGWKTLVARDGEDALLLAASHEGPLDILLTDRVLPRVDGLSLAGRLQAVRPELAVVVMSGYPERIAEGEELSHPFLAKPFTAAQLVSAMRAADAARRTTDNGGAGG